MSERPSSGPKEQDVAIHPKDLARLRTAEDAEVNGRPHEALFLVEVQDGGIYRLALVPLGQGRYLFRDAKGTMKYVGSLEADQIVGRIRQRDEIEEKNIADRTKAIETWEADGGWKK